MRTILKPAAFIIAMSRRICSGRAVDRLVAGADEQLALARPFGMTGSALRLSLA